MPAVRHSTVHANGIRIHLAEEREGPLVLLVHGFPELWYSWRHQIPAFAAAGSVILPGCGHWIQQERTEETNRILLDFLRRRG